ncbi:MAG: cupin domain-containing protein [Rhizobium sp.]|nr:cupin domain-containing protein [Rhizobium sp.]
MSTPRVVKLPLAVVPEEGPVATDRVIAGSPVQSTWLEYADPAGSFFVGRWRCTPGKWRVAYTEQEYCLLLSGVSVLTAEDGYVLTVRAGDAFVIPAGFRGTWEVVEVTTKRFVIYEPTAGAAA